MSIKNRVKQAASLSNLELLPGIKLNTGPDQYYPITQQQLIKFDGKSWVRFGNIISDVAAREIVATLRDRWNARAI